jgi:hypothetical protein
MGALRGPKPLFSEIFVSHIAAEGMQKLAPWMCPFKINNIIGDILLSGQLVHALISKKIRLNRVLPATGKVETLREGNGLFIILPLLLTRAVF